MKRSPIFFSAGSDRRVRGVFAAPFCRGCYCLDFVMVHAAHKGNRNAIEIVYST